MKRNYFPQRFYPGVLLFFVVQTMLVGCSGSASDTTTNQLTAPVPTASPVASASPAAPVSQCGTPVVIPNALWENKGAYGYKSRDEREFKYAFRGEGLRSSNARALAQQINALLEEIRQKPDLWQTPALVSPDPAKPLQYKFRVNPSGNIVTNVGFLDIYFDTADGLNYTHNAVYRFRQRFDNQAAANEYLNGGANNSERRESMSKVKREVIGEGLSITQEDRFERALPALPAKEIDQIICKFQSGIFDEMLMSPADALVDFLIRGNLTDRKEIAYLPKLFVLTERRRQHLQIPHERGAEERDTFIITVDHAHVFEADKMLNFMRAPQANSRPEEKGSFIEIEIEAFDRTVYELPKDQKVVDAVYADQQTMMNQIQSSFDKQKAEKQIELQPENKSKYNQAYEMIFK